MKKSKIILLRYIFKYKNDTQAIKYQKSYK